MYELKLLVHTRENSCGELAVRSLQTTKLHNSVVHSQQDRGLTQQWLPVFLLQNFNKIFDKIWKIITKFKIQ